MKKVWENGPASVETALNSSADVFFTTTSEQMDRIR